MVAETEMETRRKRLLFRSWHRGTKEADILFGRFVEARLTSFDEAELEQLERLLLYPDIDLTNWISGIAPWPANEDTSLTAEMTRFCLDGRHL